MHLPMDLPLELTRQIQTLRLLCFVLGRADDMRTPGLVTIPSPKGLTPLGRKVLSKRWVFLPAVSRIFNIGEMGSVCKESA